MSHRTADLSVEQMRLEFDAAFAAPLTDLNGAREIIIQILAAGEAFGVKMSEIAGLAKIRRIAALPANVPGLLGITAVRGVLYPAYDIATLLGLGSPCHDRAWIMLAGEQTSVGLIFDRLIGQTYIEKARFTDLAGSHEPGPQVVKLDAFQLPLVRVPGLVMDIRKRLAQAVQPKE